MIAYGSSLVVFGGYGSPCGPTQPGAEFVKNDNYTDGSGWSNELHVFDVMEGEHEAAGVVPEKKIRVVLLWS